MIEKVPRFGGRLPILAMPVVVFVLCFLFLTAGSGVGRDGDNPPFDIDEAHKLAETYFWHLFAEKGDLENPAWNDDFYARTNPPVGKYIFGAALAAAGFHTTDLHLQKDFERLWQDDRELRRAVPDRMLQVSRVTSALFGALAAACLCIIGCRAAGWPAGILTPLLFYAHPQMRHMASLGLYDSICLAFVLLLVVISGKAGSALAAFLGGKARLGRLLLWSIVFPALVIGLALGTKMNSFILLPYYGVFLLGVGYCSQRCRNPFRGIVMAAGSFLLTVLLSLVFFVAINPHYYASPFAKLLEMVHLSHDWTVKQQLEPGGGLFSLAERSSAVGLFTLKSSSLPLTALLGKPGCWLGVFCFLLGLACLFLRSTYMHRPNSANSEDRVAQCWHVDSVLIWIAVAIVGTTLWLPLEWIRYLMIPYAAVAVASAVGMQALLLLGYRLFKMLAHSAVGGLSPADALCMIKQQCFSPLEKVRAGICLLFLVLWALLCFTRVIVDPYLVNQGFAGMSPVGAVADHALARPLAETTFAAHYQRGLYFLQHDEIAAATERLEQALASAITSPTESPSSLVQRALVLHTLASLYAGQGDRARAITCLRRYILDVSKLQKTMWTSEPKIRSAYDRLQGENAADLVWLESWVLDRR